MLDKVNLEIRGGCTCLRARRATRQLTQVYDQVLEPAGLTVNQFGLLANLKTRDRVSLTALAELIGKHPSTVNRDLKPLKTQRLVAEVADPTDRRVRAVMITREGRERLRKAFPLWRRAQAQIENTLGAEVTHALNRLLDLTSAKLTKLAVDR